MRETLRAVQDVPLLGKTELGGKIVALAGNAKLQEVDDLSAAIVEGTENAKKVIDDLRRALTTLDAKPIIEYSKQLVELKRTLTALLKRET